MLIAIFASILLVGCEDPASAPLINANQAGNYAGGYVQMSITPTKQVKDQSEFAFFVLMPMSTGKTTTFIPIPIFEDYNVYDSEEGIKVAIEKTDELSLGQTITAYGEIREDGEKEGNYAFFIQQVLKKSK